MTRAVTGPPLSQRQGVCLEENRLFWDFFDISRIAGSGSRHFPGVAWFQSLASAVAGRF